ncbi:MAG: mevalonate kinase [Anaerolineae bacterium]
MTESVRVSAPGKLMLLGEHAVVHGRPCLVTAVDARLTMTLTPIEPDSFFVDAPDVGIRALSASLSEVFRDGRALAPGTRFIESALRLFQEQVGLSHGIAITTRSDFASTLGLGSSSATVACALFGLAQIEGVDVSPEQLFEWGLQAIRQVQGTGSGFDLAAAIFGGTLFYQVEPRRIEPLDTPDLPLLAAYSGIKADTPTYVGRVAARRAAHPAVVEHIFDLMGELALEGRAALLQNDWARLGELMDIQHGLAHALGVDVPQTAALVFAARGAGAWGAKLSGAGGGDCVIALVPPERRAAVIAAWEAAGGTLVQAAPHAPGVRLEMET